MNRYAGAVNYRFVFFKSGDKDNAEENHFVQLIEAWFSPVTINYPFDISSSFRQVSHLNYATEIIENYFSGIPSRPSVFIGMGNGNILAQVVASQLCKVKKPACQVNFNFSLRTTPIDGRFHTAYHEALYVKRMLFNLPDGKLYEQVIDSSHVLVNSEIPLLILAAARSKNLHNKEYGWDPYYSGVTVYETAYTQEQILRDAGAQKEMLALIKTLI